MVHVFVLTCYLVMGSVQFCSGFIVGFGLVDFYSDNMVWLVYCAALNRRTGYRVIGYWCCRFVCRRRTQTRRLPPFGPASLLYRFTWKQTRRPSITLTWLPNLVSCSVLVVLFTFYRSYRTVGYVCRYRRTRRWLAFADVNHHYGGRFNDTLLVTFGYVWLPPVVLRLPLTPLPYRLCGSAPGQRRPAACRVCVALPLRGHTPRDVAIPLTVEETLSRLANERRSADWHCPAPSPFHSFTEPLAGEHWLVEQFPATFAGVVPFDGYPHIARQLRARPASHAARYPTYSLSPRPYWMLFFYLRFYRTDLVVWYCAYPLFTQCARATPYRCSSSSALCQNGSLRFNSHSGHLVEG
jgi:hypothetical protein